MSADTVCRICLVNNLNMYAVRNELQNTYERITRQKFNRVGYPVSMCYICLSVLRKCDRFMETARDSNRLLEQWHIQQTEIRVAKPLATYSMAKVEFVSTENERNICSECDIKTENVDLAEQLVVDDQTDDSQTCQDIEITQVKSEIETNDELQLSSGIEIPKDLNTEINIQEPHEGDTDNIVADDVCHTENISKDTTSGILKQKNTQNEKRLHSCDICNKSYTSACGLRRHIVIKHRSTTKLNTKRKLNQKVKKYSCNDCAYKTREKYMLVRHVRTHTGEKPFSCNICSYKCAFKPNLTRHMRTHTDDSQTCQDIEITQVEPEIETNDGIQLSSGNGIRFHTEVKIEEIHESDTDIFVADDVCHTGDICNKSYASACNLRRHLVIKHTSTNKLNTLKNKLHKKFNTYSCNDCSYKCKAKSDLIRHFKTHTGGKPFSCDICSRKFAHKQNLQGHMITHTGEKPYSCNICSNKFARKTHLTRHMRTHTGEKPLACDLCNYKCTVKSSLTLHMNTHHTGEKVFVCEICSYKSKKKSHYTAHMRTHTGEKPFACNICSYKCVQKSHLTTHMRTHTGEKRFSCDICSYKCTVTSSLTTHLRTHTGEKPFECDICGYKFSVKSSLTTHMRIHTGEKPFACDKCNYKCITRSSLKHHLLTKHVNNKRK